MALQHSTAPAALAAAAASRTASMMPALRRQSPSSPTTDRIAPTAIISPAAARVRQLAAQADHRRAVAEFRARRAADQQARLNALLLEAVNALAGLFSRPDHPGNHSA